VSQLQQSIPNAGRGEASQQGKLVGCKLLSGKWVFYHRKSQQGLKGSEPDNRGSVKLARPTHLCASKLLFPTSIVLHRADRAIQTKVGMRFLILFGALML